MPGGVRLPAEPATRHTSSQALRRLAVVRLTGGRCRAARSWPAPWRAAHRPRRPTRGGRSATARQASASGQVRHTALAASASASVAGQNSSGSSPAQRGTASPRSKGCSRRRTEGPRRRATGRRVESAGARAVRGTGGEGSCGSWSSGGLLPGSRDSGVVHGRRDGSGRSAAAPASGRTGPCAAAYRPRRACGRPCGRCTSRTRRRRWPTTSRRHATGAGRGPWSSR